MLFTHLEKLYRNRAWVIVDGDKSGVEVIEQLRRRYSDRWNPDRFRTLSEEDFERYYPPLFAESVDEALGEANAAGVRR